MTNRELSDMLHRLKVNSHKESGKEYPEHMIPKSKHTGSTANGLTKAIVDYLKYNGHQAERISTMGVMRKINGVMKYTPGGTTKGSADISATVKVRIGLRVVGLSVKWEVKMKDKQSPDQKKYQENIEKSGGHYFLVHSFDEFLNQYNSIINQ